MEKQIIEQIENLINLGESYQVEFKKSENQVFLLYPFYHTYSQKLGVI